MTTSSPSSRRTPSARKRPPADPAVTITPPSRNPDVRPSSCFRRSMSAGMPCVAVYLLRPSRIASIAARWTGSGGGKSGWPSEKSAASGIPWIRSKIRRIPETSILSIRRAKRVMGCDTVSASSVQLQGPGLTKDDQLLALLFSTPRHQEDQGHQEEAPFLATRRFAWCTWRPWCLGVEDVTFQLVGEATSITQQLKPNAPCCLIPPWKPPSPTPSS